MPIFKCTASDFAHGNLSVSLDPRMGYSVEEAVANSLVDGAAVNFMFTGYHEPITPGQKWDDLWKALEEEIVTTGKSQEIRVIVRMNKNYIEEKKLATLSLLTP